MPGRNEIRVEVINTWNNRIVGDLKASGGKVYTKTNARYRFRNDSPLLPSGLIGNAEILFIEKKLHPEYYFVPTNAQTGSLG